MKMTYLLISCYIEMCTTNQNNTLDLIKQVPAAAEQRIGNSLEHELLSIILSKNAGLFPC